VTNSHFLITSNSSFAGIDHEAAGALFAARRL
jgi:hypothetical protein